MQNVSFIEYTYLKKCEKHSEEQGKLAEGLDIFLFGCDNRSEHYVRILLQQQ